MLKALFAGGHAVDLVFGVIVVEFVVLTLRRAGRGERLSMTDRALAFAPGVCLLLALRASLTGAGFTWVALALAASFPFHIADLARRGL